MKTIKVNGMSCQHCVKAVTKALEEIDGVGDVKVDLSLGEVSFQEKTPIELDILREKVEKAGFKLG